MASITHVLILAVVQLILLAVALTSCSSIANRRIWGGQRSERGQFPFIVSLRLYVLKNDKGELMWVHICAGSILSDKFIVTAAQCYVSSHPLLEPYGAFVGAITRSDGQGYKLESFLKHPEFNQDTFSNDIAIIKLADSIQFNENVTPIEVERKFVEGAEESTITGWGYNEQSENTLLRYVKVATLTNDDCQRKLGKQLEIDVSKICTLGQMGTGLCTGDSGGPLLQNGKLIGIGLTYLGRHCADNTPDGFTRISEFVDWIDEMQWSDEKDFLKV